MISEILIEGSRLDLFDDIGAELNYAIDDIKDFASRNTNYSKTITLPGNANNNKVFGHIYNFASANNYNVSNPDIPNVGYNFDPTKQAEAKIFVNKIQVFKGVIRLLEVKINDGAIEYECVVFGELGGFSAAIGNSLIEEMDNFNDYSEAWTVNNIVASWDPSGAVASGIGIVYPLIDYGNCKHGGNGGNNRDYHIDAFRPAFHVYEFMDSIIKNANYTYESAFFETPYFKSLLIPNNKAKLEQLQKDLLFVDDPLVKNFGSLGAIEFNIINNLFLFTSSNNQDFVFTGDNGTLGKITLVGAPYLTKVGSFTIRVMQGSTQLYTQSFSDLSGFQQFPINQIIDVTLNTNDTLQVLASFTTSEQDCELYPNLFFQFQSDYPQVAPATIGGTLNMKNLLPKGIQQKDFFASICRLFNLYVFEDPEISNHLLIEPYIDFYLKGAGFLKINDLGELLLHGEPGDPTGLLLLSDPSADSIDWSNKVDHSKEITLRPMSELNARYFEFKYKEDDDYYNEEYQKKYNQTYADRREDSKYQFAEDSQNVEVIFSPSVLVKRSATDTKLCASIFSIEDGNEVPKDHNIRIMQFAYVEEVDNYHIKQAYPSNSNATSGHLNVYGYAGHLDNPTEPTNDLNFAIPNQVYFNLTNPYPSTNLFTAFWSEYIAEITSKDSKLLTCYLYLTVEDIYSLNFARLIYIDGALFRLNKIIDFNPAIPETTKVELLRVIELTYS
jgi:hypothetical protein